MQKHRRHTTKYDSVFKVNPNLKPLPADHPIIVQKQEEFDLIVGSDEKSLFLKLKDLDLVNNQGQKRDISSLTVERNPNYIRNRYKGRRGTSIGQVQSIVKIIRILATTSMASVVHVLEIIKRLV